MSKSDAIRTEGHKWLDNASLEEVLNHLPPEVVSRALALQPSMMVGSETQETAPSFQPRPRRTSPRMIKVVRHRVKPAQSYIIRRRVTGLKRGTPEYQKVVRELCLEMRLTKRQVGGAVGQLTNPRHPAPGPGRRRKTAPAPVASASATA